MVSRNLERQMRRRGITPDTGETRYVPPSQHPAARQGAGAGYYVLGAAWGTVIGYLGTQLNQGYEALFQSGSAPPVWALVAAGFLALSLLLLLGMLLSGLLGALVGRIRSRRWVVLILAIVFVGVGNRVAVALAGAGG